jgi:MYXO-CTERM domain-containing protein
MKSLLFATATLALVATSASNAALVYGGGTETGSRFNAGAAVITYMNCFTAVGAGQTQLAVDSAIVGIRRLVASGALVDVGIKIYAAEMTYDGTNFGRGANYEIYSSASLGAGAASVTQLVNTGAVSGVTLNLETVSNAAAGLGGWWIGVEFTGANAANTANGWRVVNTPTTGASINGFGMFNYQASGAFQAFYTLGASPTPSRFMVDVNGTLVPAPGALALLGVAGLAGARRRRS